VQRNLRFLRLRRLGAPVKRADWKHGKNRKPLRRGWIKPSAKASLRKSRIKPKRLTAAEKREKFAREYHSDAFVRWIRSLPSVASGHGPCVAAHTENDGKSRKGSWKTIVPLTDTEHREEHQHGRQTFEAKYGIDIKACAARTAAAWLAHSQEEAA
jgi:hypothetical protein